MMAMRSMNIMRRLQSLAGPCVGDHHLPSSRQHPGERGVVDAKIELKTMFRRLFDHGLRERGRGCGEERAEREGAHP